MSLPAVLAARAAELGRVAGVAWLAAEPFAACPWSLSDPSITRRREAVKWFAAFEKAAHI